MKWYVYRRNVNAGKIEKFNVFDHRSYKAAVEELLATKLDRTDFASALKSETMYYFWSKCEHEVVVTSWPPYISMEELNRLNEEFATYEEKWGIKSHYLNVNPTVGEKIDIYDQLMLNWDAFVSYVYTHLNLERGE